MASEWWEKAASIVMLERNQQKEKGRKITVQVLLVDLKACSSTGNLERGQQVHAEATESGHDSNIYVANALINMYAKCGSMIDACQIFDKLKHPTVVSWNALIMGYASNGQGQNALELFTRMKSEGLGADTVTFMASFKACSSLAVKGGVSVWDRGKQLHNLFVESACSSNSYLRNTIIDMYAKCGSVVDAHQMFDRMKHRDVVSWNALILGYADIGQGHTALKLFTRMKKEGSEPNYVTFMAAFKACSSLAVDGGSGSAECRNSGKEICNLAAENGCSSVIYVQNTLLDMYTKCNSMVDARQVFDSLKHRTVVSWNALILGYANNRQGHTALVLFTTMKTEGPAPNSVTFVAVIMACTSLAVTECKDKCKAVHNLSVENGCNNIYVQNSLIDMYAKCGCMVDARVVFDCLRNPDVVSWTKLILGYADNTQGRTALDMLTMMRTKGVAPDSVTFMAALKACSLVGALELGRVIHSEIENVIGLDVVLVNSLVHFYAKCGSLVEARSVFDLHAETRDLITWNALFAGFSNYGDYEAVFGLFEEMQDAGFCPDGITFLCILTCCSHVGLVQKGKEYFDAMPTKYGVVPNVKHYTCMIDLFGRANKIDDAIALLDHMPFTPNDATWMNVLGACQKWKNLQIGRLALHVLKNDSESSSRVS